MILISGDQGPKDLKDCIFIFSGCWEPNLWSPYIQRKVGNSEPSEVIFFRKKLSAFGPLLLGLKLCVFGLHTSSEAKVRNSEPTEVICLRNKYEPWNLKTNCWDIENTWKDKMARLKYLKKLDRRVVQPLVGHLKIKKLSYFLGTPC